MSDCNAGIADAAFFARRTHTHLKGIRTLWIKRCCKSAGHPEAVLFKQQMAGTTMFTMDCCIRSSVLERYSSPSSAAAAPGIWPDHRTPVHASLSFFAAAVLQELRPDVSI